MKARPFVFVLKILESFQIHVVVDEIGLLKLNNMVQIRLVVPSISVVLQPLGGFQFQVAVHNMEPLKAGNMAQIPLVVGHDISVPQIPFVRIPLAFVLYMTVLNLLLLLLEQDFLFPMFQQSS